MKKVEFVPQLLLPSGYVGCYIVDVDGETFGALYPDAPETFALWVDGTPHEYNGTLGQVKAEIVKYIETGL